MNEEYRNAIGTVESGNNYGALGPVTRRGDRAYGRYQVMGANIPEWTARHLGVALTPQQFLASREAQDAVFDRETGAQYQKHGNLNDVTSTWFSGRPMAQAGNASDGYNTVPQYVSKVNGVLSHSRSMIGAMHHVAENVAPPPQPQDAVGAIGHALHLADPEGEPSQALGFAATAPQAAPPQPAPAPAPAAPQGGMFDDLIAQHAPQPQAALTPPAAAPAPAAAPPAAAPQGGMFDDLIAQHAAPQAAAAPPSPPISTPYAGDAPPANNPQDFSATRAVTQGATGFNEGLSSSVLRPLDVVPYLASKVLGGEGVHPFEGTFNEHFVDLMGQPQNRPEQVLRAGGRMAGANMPLLAAGQGAAGAGIRAGVNLAEQAGPGIINKIRGAADSVLEGIANNPMKSFVGENAGATLSGSGGQTGRIIATDAGGTPQQQDAADILGQYAAPFGAHMWSRISPTGVAAKVVKYGAGKVLDNVPPDILPGGGGSYAERKAAQYAYSNREGEYADPNAPPPSEGNFLTRRVDNAQASREGAAGSTASKELNQILEQPQAASNLSETQRLEDTIPGFQPGVAKGTQDPALLKLQEHIESRATGDELRAAQENYDNNSQAVRKYVDQIVPPQGENPQDLVAATNAARVKNTADAVAHEADSTRGVIQARSDALPEIDRAAAGQTLREIRSGEEGASNAHVNELRTAIDPTGEVRVLQTRNKYNAKNMEGGVTVDQALERRGQINNDIRDIVGGRKVTPDDRAAIAALNAEKDTIDNAVREVNPEAFAEYQRYYRDEHIPRFGEGASRKVGQYDQYATEKNKVQSEDVPKQFFGPNNVTEARDFNRLYGTGDEPHSVMARKAMTDYALDDLRHTAVDPTTSMIKPGSVDRWLQKNERLLNEMPWIRQAVEARNPKQLYDRLGELEQRQRAVADTKVAQLVGKNPEQHIDAALKDWQTMRGLKSSVRGDPQAEAALRRSVMDRAPDPMNADKFEAWLDQNDRSLRQVLDPTHLKALRDVLAAARVQNQLPRPTGAVDLPGSMADKAAGKFGITIPSLLQRALAVKQGRMSAAYGAADVATRIARQFSNKEVESAWKEALYNPKVARDLEVMTREGATPIQLARMRNYLLTVGVSGVTGQNQSTKALPPITVDEGKDQ